MRVRDPGARAINSVRRWLVPGASPGEVRGFHEHARKRRPGRLYDLARLVLGPLVRLLYRPRGIGAEAVPERGPAIIAANHFSYLDPMLVAYCLQRKLRWMAWSGLFETRLRMLIPYLGAFPVHPGARDEETFRTAHLLLSAGELLVIYPEGGRSPPGELRRAKPGVGRLALESGAPVIPAAIVGSEEVRHWTRLHFPAVLIRYGEAIHFERVDRPTREQAQAAAERIFDVVKRLYAEGTHERRSAET